MRFGRREGAGRWCVGRNVLHGALYIMGGIYEKAQSKHYEKKEEDPGTHTSAEKGAVTHFPQISGSTEALKRHD